MLGQELGHNAGGNTGFSEFTVQIQAWRDQGGFDGVQHIKATGQIAKTVPFAALAVGLDDPVVGPPNAFIDHFVRSPDLEPPVFAIFLIDFAHRTSKVQGLSNALLHQSGPARGFHHGRGHIAARNDGVLRRGARVHQISFIEKLAIKFGVL